MRLHIYLLFFIYVLAENECNTTVENECDTTIENECDTTVENEWDTIVEISEESKKYKYWDKNVKNIRKLYIIKLYLLIF